jgi:hypothetical protein
LLSLIHGIGGTAALIATSLAMPFVEKRGPRAVPLFIGAAICVGTIPSIIAFTTASASLATVMLWLFIPLSYCAFGPTLGLVQNLVPADMRAQAVALLLFFSNIANLVLAPQLVGLVSDSLAPRFGAESLRLALLPLTLCGFWAAAHFGIVARRSHSCQSAGA